MATSFPCVRRSAHALLVLMVATAICGCESFDTSPIKKMFARTPEPTQAEVLEYRERFQRSQDPEALQWLLANQVENGMSRAEVEGVLGQSGRYEPSDRMLKKNNNAYRSSDKMYAFGPDSKSRTYFLVFRDNLLVGFESKDFKSNAFEAEGL